jgi:hypothetical protein
VEEQFRLAQSRRFAPGSENLRDRVFGEAGQIAAIEPDNDTGGVEDTLALPDADLPDAPGRHEAGPDANRYRHSCHASAPNATCQNIRSSLHAVHTHFTVWATKSANSCISR